MKTKLIIIVLFVLAFATGIYAQTAKPKQAVKKTTAQTTVKKASATKTVMPDVVISSYEEYDEFDGEEYDVYYIADKKTGEKIKELYSYERVYNFSEGLALAQRYSDYKWGFIDKTGKEVIPFNYNDARNFTEGLAAVEINFKWGFIDKAGKIIIPLQYVQTWSFSEGLAQVRLNNKIGFINKTGAIVIPLKYEYDSDYYYSNGFSEGLARVKLNNKFGFIDKKGKEIIPIIYDTAGNFTNGEVAVTLNGRKFFIDKTGKEIK